jgi:hypothetical protein
LELATQRTARTWLVPYTLLSRKRRRSGQFWGDARRRKPIGIRISARCQMTLTMNRILWWRLERLGYTVTLEQKAA